MSALPEQFEKHLSETAGVRDYIVPRWVRLGMTGLDIGYGGDPICPEAICLDRKDGPYMTPLGQEPQHLYGDCRTLRWFADEQLDYVYSSHVLEDLPPADLKPALREWLRVLKVGGLIILCLPDEVRYEARQRALGRDNPHHQNPVMGLAFMQKVFQDMGIREEFAWDDTEGYNFLIVGRKQTERGRK